MKTTSSFLAVKRQYILVFKLFILVRLKVAMAAPCDDRLESLVSGLSGGVQTHTRLHLNDCTRHEDRTLGKMLVGLPVKCIRLPSVQPTTPFRAANGAFVIYHGALVTHAPLAPHADMAVILVVVSIRMDRRR